MIIPNDPIKLLSLEPDGERRDFMPLLEEHGYRLTTREPVLDDPAVQELVELRDHFHLFSRGGSVERCTFRAPQRADYVAHSAALIHSVLAHRGGLDVQVHFLHGPRFDDGDSERLAQMVELHRGSISFLEIDDKKVAGLPSESRLGLRSGTASSCRTSCPASPGSSTSTPTWSPANSRPLWETDLDGYWLGAVTNVFQPNHIWRPKELGLPNREVYFNSGVLLMNLAEMRRDRKTDELLELVAALGRSSSGRTRTP